MVAFKSAFKVVVYLREMLSGVPGTLVKKTNITISH